MESPGMFNPSFFSLDNSLSAQAAFDPSHQGLARNHLQVPRQAFTPFTQHAYSPNYSRPQDRQQGSYPSSPSWQLHSRQHQHALPQYGNHYTFGSARQQPFALAHALHAKAAAETKARLDKKHVEILEQEFQRNQKPSSIVKRELAEQMGHEIARINNWFQNRRAKEKSNRRTAEYAAREAKQDRDGRTLSGPRSPDLIEDGGADGHLILDTMQRPIMSSAAIGIGEIDTEDDGPSEQRQRRLDESEGGADASPQDEDDDTRSNSHLDEDGPTVTVSHEVRSEDEAQESFQTPTSDLSQGFDYPSLQDLNGGLPRVAGNSLDYLDDGEIPTAWFHPLPQAPSDYFGADATPLSPLNAATPMAMAKQFPSKDAIKVQQLASPVSMSSTSETPPPPPKEMASHFAANSPRPINIAARRNHQRPAALGLPASRKASYSQGPKTGVDFPRRRADITTPMRRTTSATGLRLPRVSEGLRSPGLYFQRTRSPSYNSSGSSVSPGRVDTPVTHNSDEHHSLPYGNFNAPLTSRFESSINTPPVTPGLPLGYSGFANPFEQAWAHAGTEQPVATPSLCSHGGSETDFPGTSHMPNYIASQPATPCFPRPDAFGPAFRFGHGGMPSAPEYTFPDSSSYVDTTLGSSPHEHAMSKTFQFAQNVTPQDFSHEN